MIMNNSKNKFDEAIRFIKAKSTFNPEILIILGSGLGAFAKLIKDRIDIPYADIPHFRAASISGHKGVLSIGTVKGKSIYCMQGRNHYYEGCTNEEMRFPIQLFALLGVKVLILTNACGSMVDKIKPGTMALITDHINMMGKNPMEGDNQDYIGPRFFDMSEPYNKELNDIAKAVAKENNIELNQGVYVSYLGPSYETKAEIKAYRAMGGDLIGMSTVPEVIVARHAGIKVLGIASVTNMATGISEVKLSHEEVLTIGAQIANTLGKLLTQIVERL